MQQQRGLCRALREGRVTMMLRLVARGRWTEGKCYSRFSAGRTTNAGSVSGKPGWWGLGCGSEENGLHWTA